MAARRRFFQQLPNFLVKKSTIELAKFLLMKKSAGRHVHLASGRRIRSYTLLVITRWRC